MLIILKITIMNIVALTVLAVISSKEHLGARGSSNVNFFQLCYLPKLVVKKHLLTMMKREGVIVEGSW